MEGWAELRREHFVRGVSIKELMRRTGLACRRRLNTPHPWPVEKGTPRWG